MSQNWGRKQKPPYLGFLLSGVWCVYVFVSLCPRKGLYSRLEPQCEGPPPQSSFSSSISPRSPLSAAHCASISWAVAAWYSLLSRPLLPLLLPYSFYLPLLLLASAMQVPFGLSAVSLADSSSVHPSPGHLKERKSPEAGETKAFKAGHRTGVFAVPREWKLLQRALLPLCSG